MRYASVDILRGMTVAVMILVNNPGSWQHVHPWLLHAPWNGLGLADLVFPFFLFIAGLSIVFSLNNALSSGASKKQLALKCLKRAVILIAMGLFINLFPNFDWEQLRIPGVLQRIGLVVGICSLLFIYFSENQRKIIVLAILIGYWLLLCFVPVPGLGVVSLEKNQNWASWIDQLILQGHMWRYSQTWDPEGLLSTLPAIATCLLGISAALYMKKSAYAVKGLTIAGTVAILLGLIWSFVFPMNKALWTSSFVLVTAGIAMLCLAVAIYCFDDKRWTSGTLIFKALGSNTLAVYFGSELLARVLIYSRIHNFTLNECAFSELTAIFSPQLASFMIAFLTVGFWALIALFLYKKKIFFKI